MSGCVFLSVVIPAYNEENRIELTLKRIQNYLEQRGFLYEIIVVDDGSSDRTPQIVGDFIRQHTSTRNPICMLQNAANEGKGYSVKRGMLQSHGEYILFSDADLSAPIEELDKLLATIERNECDIAIGSRGLPDSDILVAQDWYRKFMGRIFNVLVQFVLLGGIMDTQCGFKCFKGHIVQEILQKERIRGFGFDVEILYIARKYNYRIREIPIRWMNSPATHVHLVWSSLEMFLDLIKIKINDWQKKY